MVGPVFAGGRQGDPPGLDRAIAAQESHTNALLARPGVVGTAVGLGADGQAVVVIYTASAGVSGLPHRLDGVPAKVRVTGRFFALCHKGGNDPKGCDQPPPEESVDPTARFDRPVPIGVSTGHPDITAGTIGARVTDGPNVYALSNNHVYAATNSAEIGESALQPGTIDGGTDPADKIGELSDFEPIDFSGGDNTMDAAIAISSTDLLGNSTPSDDGYGTPSSTTVAASLDLPVQKYGRTTNNTFGTVSEINVTVNVCYEGFPFCTKLAKFVDQIAISDGSFSAGGDSGSLIVTNDTSANPVGLLFAGSSTRTLANRIDLVLAAFVVTIDGPAVAPTNDPPTVSITSPADGSTSDSGATILFEGTASDTEDGDLTGSLAWTSDIDGAIGTGGSFSTTLSDGNHTITAEVTDSDEATGSASVSITVGTPPAEATTVSVASIGYATEGGKNGDKHLLTTVALEDDLNSAVGGASVSVTLAHAEGGSWTGTATTGGDGTVTFTLKNAASGCYTTTVTDVTAAGLSWDPNDPANTSEQFCK